MPDDIGGDLGVKGGGGVGRGVKTGAGICGVGASLRWLQTGTSITSLQVGQSIN